MTKKHYNWIWLTIAIMPLVLIIFNQTLINEFGNTNIAVLLNNLGFHAQVYRENNLYTLQFMPINNETSLEFIIQKFLDNLLPNRNSTLLSQYTAYIIRLDLIKIVVDVFTMLPKICSGLMDKLIGGTKVE